MAVEQNEIPQWPVYLPLELDLEYPALLEEALSIPRSYFVEQKTFWPGGTLESARERFQGLLVGSEALNREAPRLYVEDGQIQWTEGSAKLFRGMNLTCLPGEPASLHQAVHYDGEKFRRLRIEGAGQWRWREDVWFPKLKQMLERLPFSHMSVVRLNIYEDGAFVPAHLDEPNGNYRRLGYMPINIILQSGGVNMLFQANGKTYEATSPVCAFDFSFPHGVPPVSGGRVMICAEGLIDIPRFKAMGKWDHVIWDQSTNSFPLQNGAESHPARRLFD